MKQFTLHSIISILLVLITTFATAGEYKPLLEKRMQSYYEADSLIQKQKVTLQIERIAIVEFQEWIPQYFAALTFIFLSHDCPDNDTKDKMLDRAEFYLNRGIALQENNSELYALQAMWYSSKMGVNPAVRGMVYSGKLNTALEKAIALDNTNPRAYFLRGQYSYHAPAAFGGGKTKALEYFKKADQLYKSKKISSILTPSWGEIPNTQMLQKVTKELEPEVK